MSNQLTRLTAALADHYTIEREIGEGGMATVYLAHDRKHDRKVAVKVLRPELAAIIGGERFVNEIKVTANLQHPNILPLYDSGEADSFLYYVMPFVEGESLRDRLVREKQLALDEALKITEAVAGALQYAHERKIVHRDIKPENILLQAGQPLVADFGIALAVSQAGGRRLTETGLSLGTPHYMSPEQATGDRELDARSDVYSLGAMLYEMLAGEPPHLGNSAQAIVAKILTDHPEPVSKRRDTVPANVDAALQVALAKLPADRFASAGAFAQALANPAFTHATTAIRTATFADANRWRRLAIAGAATSLLLGALAALGWLRDRAADDQAVVRFALPALDSVTGAAANGAVSPDGKLIVLQMAGDGGSVLVQRSLDALTTVPLALGNGSAHTPFFSPDGTQLGFINSSDARSAVQIVPAGGGPPRTLIEDVATLGANWGDDGFIYFGLPGFMIGRIPSAGGPVDTVYVPQGGGAGFPVPLPGGQAVVFTEGPSAAALSMIVLDLTTRERRVLARGGPWAAYVPSGHLLFTRDRFLMAAPIDVKRMAFTAEPTPVAEVPSGEFGWFAFGGGTLVYRGSAGLGGANRPVLLNRRGDRQRLANLPGGQDYGYPAVSPDGRKIALRVQPIGVSDAALDIWIYELPDGPLTRLTFEGSNDDPSWTPDGRRVLFDSDRGGGDRRALFLKPWDGSGPAELALQRDGDLWRTSWLPDGRRFVFYEAIPGSPNRDLGLAVLGAPDSTRPLFPSPSAEDWPAVSPDGRWLAYASNESGRSEVYVRPLEGQGTRRQVSRLGGDSPVWARSGRELLFVAGDSVYGAALDIGADIAVRSVRALLALPCCANVGFDVLPGDSLFVGFEFEDTQDAPDEQPVIVVHNFLSELRTRLGARR